MSDQDNNEYIPQDDPTQNLSNLAKYLYPDQYVAMGFGEDGETPEPDIVEQDIPPVEDAAATADDTEDDLDTDGITGLEDLG